MTNLPKRPLRVLIVEDSRVVREFLLFIFGQDADIEVVGVAASGEEALHLVNTARPDVITMDINLPGINGFETTRRIMETHPTPIVIVSGSVDAKEVSTTFRAIEAGALAVLPRPQGFGHAAYESTARELINSVKTMAEVGVVRRWPSTTRSRVEAPRARPSKGVLEIVAMGASTGGPGVLRTVLSGLPRPLPVPVLIVQHMAPGFLHGFADWLTTVTHQPVRPACDHEPLSPGQVYLAPDKAHLRVTPERHLRLDLSPLEHGVRPSISHLFRSVAAVFGARAAGVLLTGMGADGADALKQLSECGGLTVVQDEASSVVWGMGKEAHMLGAARYVLPPGEIAALLSSYLVDLPPSRP